LPLLPHWHPCELAELRYQQLLNALGKAAGPLTFGASGALCAASSFIESSAAKKREEAAEVFEVLEDVYNAVS